LSGEKLMPGTILAGENAACSISAKKFSGFRFSSIAHLDQRVIASARPWSGRTD
jgi:hypothetical protein